ncbi:unnamed protein product [Mytilus coruscus]|uniref:Uncharacterized protein n=1 Tax=Mytilus coruscus TaxID=42192 RepID=A0A6J8E1B7_MYTCO|nr:unnamed protein product [Mytilus coruscus]
MKCEVNVYIKRLLSTAKSSPGIVFILCVYTFTTAAVYLHIEDHKKDNNENRYINKNNKLISCNDSGIILQNQYQCEDDNTLNYLETLLYFVAMITTISIGIPLTAIIITSIGKRLSSFVTCLLMRKRCQERITRHRRDIQKGDKIDTFIETEAYENTVVKDTIGVGATVPSDSAYYIGSVIYILTGLTLLSMCVYAALQYNNVKPPTEPSERKENNANVEQ